MKILVLSDSHGSVSKIISAIDREKPDYVIFLGDKVCDILEVCDNYSGVRFIIVSGNCDGPGSFTGFSERIVTVLDDVTFYITHGHNERVKSGYMELISKAFEFDVNIALFGHTHMTCKNNYSGLELLNPGSIGQGDYGVVLINDRKIETYLKNINDLSC
jgi:putative phosphoesterase